MRGRETEAFDGKKMLPCAITLVPFKTILWIFFVKRKHFSISRYFRYNRSQRDYRLFFVAFNNCFLIFKFLRRFEPSVQEHLANIRFHVKRFQTICESRINRTRKPLLVNQLWT